MAPSKTNLHRSLLRQVDTSLDLHSYTMNPLQRPLRKEQTSLSRTHQTDARENEIREIGKKFGISYQVEKALNNTSFFATKVFGQPTYVRKHSDGSPDSVKQRAAPPKPSNVLIELLDSPPEPTLASDFSNIGDVSISELKKCPRQRELLAKLREEVLKIAQAGEGVEQDRLPTMLRQSGDECTVLAILNGALAVAGRTAVISWANRAEEIRRGADEQAKGGRSNIFFISRVMMQLGFPLRKPEATNLNPVGLAKQLFQARRFFVTGDGHAETLLPLKNPTCEAFLLKISSRTGMRPMSLDEYLSFVLGQKNFIPFEYKEQS